MTVSPDAPCAAAHAALVQALALGLAAAARRQEEVEARLAVIERELLDAAGRRSWAPYG